MRTDENEPGGEDGHRTNSGVVPNWEQITPAKIVPAVKHIRGNFSQRSSQVRLARQRECFTGLHPVANGYTEPEVFRFFFFQCVETICGLIRDSFSRLLAIARAQSAIFDRDPVDWCEVQVKSLIDLEGRHVDGWIKWACDQQQNDPETSFEEMLFGNEWRAPRWLKMHPNGNIPYDSATAWVREDGEHTGQLLKALRENRWILALRTTLKNVVGQAHEALAAESPADAQSTPSSTRRSNRKKSKMQERREGVAFAAIQAELEGPKYCRYLDEHGIHPLPGWISERCPRTYVAAYSQGEPWRKKIQDEKHRFQLKYNKLSPIERGRLIEAATRPTRS